jgi:hypothetical protein
VFFAVFGLFSCMEYQETLKLDSDGSGIITLRFLSKNGPAKFPTPVEVSRRFDRIEGIQVISQNLIDSGSSFDVTLRFRNLHALQNIGGLGKHDQPVGQFRLMEDSLGQNVFERIVFLRQGAGAPDSMDAFAQSMFRGLFGETIWSYQVLFPGKVVSTNGDELDSTLNSVVWHRPLMNLIQRPDTMRVVYIAEMPSDRRQLMITIGISGLLILGLSFMFLGKKKKKSKKLSLKQKKQRKNSQEPELISSEKEGEPSKGDSGDS